VLPVRNCSPTIVEPMASPRKSVTTFAISFEDACVSRSTTPDSRMSCEHERADEGRGERHERPDEQRHPDREEDPRPPRHGPPAVPASGSAARQAWSAPA